MPLLGLKEKQNERGNKMDFRYKDKSMSRDTERDVETSGLEFSNSSSKKIQKSLQETINKEI